MNNHRPQLLNEALEYQDLVGMMKPRVHVDEFASKMGDDDDIIVVSFFVRSKEAARDLVNWFEKGYDFVMDADQSPGEIRPGRYLVYVELRRRSSAGTWVADMIDDLATLTEYESKDWTLSYERKDYPFSKEEFDRLIPLSPKDYRKVKETGLNEMRIASGLDPVQIYKPTKELRQLQAAAGI
jgi:hypothetical protein